MSKACFRRLLLMLPHSRCPTAISLPTMILPMRTPKRKLLRQNAVADAVGPSLPLKQMAILPPNPNPQPRNDSKPITPTVRVL